MLRSRPKCVLALAVANVALMLSPGARVAHAESWIGPAPADGSVGGDWNTAAHWDLGSVPNAIGAAATINGSPVSANSTRIMTLSAPVTLASLTFNDNNTDAALNTRAVTVNADGGPLLTFDNGGAGVSINSNGSATTTSANVFAIRGPVFLAEQLTVNANLLRASTAPGGVPNFDNATITINFLGAGASAITGPGGITKNGPGTLAFADTAKAFTGPVIINQGRIRFNAAAGDAGGFSGTSSITVNAGGQLHFDSAGTGTNNHGASPDMVVTLNGNGMTNYSGAIRVETGRITSMHNKVNLASDASITTNGATSVLTLSNVISGPGALAHNNGPAAGGGTLVLTGANTYGGGTTNSAGTLRIGPTGSVSGNVTNNGTFQVYANTTLADVSGTGTTVIGDGTSAVTVTANHFRQGTLNVRSKAVIAQTGGGAAGVSKVSSFILDAAATLDLKDNKLISNNAAGTATEGTYNGVQGQVQSAYNFGSWNGAGLTTSMQLALDGIATIGVATGEQIRGLGPTDTDLWAGQTINGASTIAMYTYAGDANLDGQVDAGDYGILDAFIQVPGATGYGNGDFNYDGFIDPADYGTIDNSIQFQGPPIFTSGGGLTASGVTAVPEPASLSVLGLAAASLFSRRRRSR